MFRGWYRFKAFNGVLGTDKPFYSPDVFESDVHDPSLHLESSVRLEMIFEFLNLYLITTDVKINLLRAGFGLQWYYNLKHFDELCSMFYYDYELISIKPEITLNTKTCEYSIGDHIKNAQATSFWRKLDCNYIESFKTVVDLGEYANWSPLPQLSMKEFPVAGCLF